MLFGRGVCAAIDPLLMMRPPRGFWLLHDAHGFLRAQEHPREIGVHHGGPLIEAEIFHRNARRTDARVVEQQIQATERVVRPS